MTTINNRNERGEIIQLIPDTLLIPPALHFTAKTLLESERQVGTAQNDKNVVQNLVSPVEWQYLTDTDAWILGQRQKGLKFYERKAPVIDFYQDEKDKKYYATIDTRFGAVVDNWRYWVAANLATS
jgi:phage major head subunit gpT-like protein